MARKSKPYMSLETNSIEDKFEHIKKNELVRKLLSDVFPK